MTEPTWQTPDGAAQLYLGDCLQIMPGLGKVDACVTDPPYGIGYFHSGCKSGKTSKVKNKVVLKRIRKNTFSGKGAMIKGDNKPFDPKPIIELGVPTILWGGNHYASRLPDSGGWLIWDKVNSDNNYGKWSFSDCEMAWTNTRTTTRIFPYTWQGMIRSGEGHSKHNGKHPHPNVKPIALMCWCLSFIPKAEIILDPYMGSGTTGCACMQLGRRFIGIEIEPKYFDIAKDRIQTAWEDAQNDLFKNQQQEILEQGSIFE